MTNFLKKIKLEVNDDLLHYAMAKSDTIPQVRCIGNIRLDLLIYLLTRKHTVKMQIKRKRGLWTNFAPQNIFIMKLEVNDDLLHYAMAKSDTILQVCQKKNQLGWIYLFSFWQANAL